MESHDVVVAVLSLAFGLWAGVVGWIGQGIRKDLHGIAADLKEESRKLNSHIVATEKRLAIIETHFQLNPRG